jgi:hypothetical protein
MAQVISEGIVTLLPGGKKLVAVEVVDVALVNGAAALTVASVNKIDYVIGTIRSQTLVNTKVVAMNYEVGTAANQITATFEVATTGTWADAATADLADAVVSFLVVGN